MEATFFDDHRACWLRARDPVHVLTTRSLHQVPTLVIELERRVASGLTAIGYVSYDAAPAFDPSLVVPEGSDPTGVQMPLLCFGLFDTLEELREYAPGTLEQAVSVNVCQTTTEANYREAHDRVKEYLRAGESYQVNLTHRLSVSGSASPEALFQDLVSRQQCRYPVSIKDSEGVILSVSPELFFELDGEHIVCRPMKGTKRRSLDPATDEDARVQLAASAKDRAENLMIVDMIRNDLGRIADPGTVQVSELFAIEAYPTVWQMTSTVEANTDASLLSLLTALFPCASITGAPKVHTMSIIRELESSARGLYTGAIGVLRPNRYMRFSVAIRTLVIDSGRDENWQGYYGVGGGIVADSDSVSEWDESLAKAAILAMSPSAKVL